MIRELMNEYTSRARAAATVDYANEESVRRFNAADNRMRAIVDEVVTLMGVPQFAAILDGEPAATRAAHHLVERTALDPITLSRCFQRVEQAKEEAEAKGDFAEAMGQEMWLKEWKAKRDFPDG